MSSHSENNRVSFPSSYIKPPGLLLKDKKDSFQVKSNDSHIQSLLCSFKINLSTSLDSLAEASPHESEGENLSDHAGTFFCSIMKTHCPVFEMSPGKLKNLSDQMSLAIYKAEEILRVYGLELIIEHSQGPKEIVNLLKLLIPEICFFPSNFFRNIQLQQLILCKGEDAESCFSKGKAQFSLLISDINSDKICKRLYKIIFDHLILSYPNLNRKWNEIVAKQGELSPNSSSWGLEETFMGLMIHTNYISIKPQIKRLREALACYYPEGFSEERFLSRNKEKKKLLKVHFEC